MAQPKSNQQQPIWQVPDLETKNEELPMSNKVAVTVGDGVNKLRKQSGSVGLRESLRSKNTIIQSGFLTQIRDNEKMRFGFKEGMNLENVGVRRENL